MKSKKIMIILITVVTLIGILSSSVFAGNHQKTTPKTSYSQCNISNCRTTYNRTHSGNYYYGHGKNDGHSQCKTTTTNASYAKCNINNCKTTSGHSHNGKHYYGHSLNDGHNQCKSTNTHTPSKHH